MVDDWAFWDISAADLLQRREQYDSIAANLTDKQKKELEDFVAWAHYEGVKGL